MWRSYTQETLPQALWRETTATCLFCDPNFLSLWSAIGAHPLYFLNEIACDDEVKYAGFSTLAFSAGPLRRCQAQIDGLPGKIVTSSPDARPSAGMLVDALQCLSSTSGLRNTWVDYDGIAANASLPRGWASSLVTTQIVSADTIRANAYSSTAARHIRSGLSRGASVTQLANPRQAWRCYELVCDTESRRGLRPRYPEALYLSLAKYSLTDARVLWFLCVHDGEIVGFHISLQIGEELFSWQPYIDYERRDCKPAYLLMNAVLNEALSRNLRRVNLGGSPEGAAGLREFKSRFGAVEYEYPVYTHVSRLGRALTKARR